MTPRHYHNPPAEPSTRIRCPVCHQLVYSRAGIHPQCAVRQSDPPKPKPKPPAPIDPSVGVPGADDAPVLLALRPEPAAH